MKFIQYLKLVLTLSFLFANNQVFAFMIHFYADTIDFYHVYYSDDIIKKYNLFHVNQDNLITLDASNIKEKDSIKVRYWDDTPCFDCSCYLNIYNKKMKVMSVTSIGVGNFLSISLYDLLAFAGRYKIYEYDIEYYEDSSPQKRILFSILLE